MRAFVSIDLPKGMRSRIHGLQSALPQGLSLVKEDNLHITLQFLGDITNGNVQRIRQSIDKAQLEKFKITLRGISSFDSPYPKVIFAKVEDFGATGASTLLYPTTSIRREYDSRRRRATLRM